MGRVDDWRGGPGRWGVAVSGEAGASVHASWLRFQSPLVAPYMWICLIRRSDRASRFSPTEGCA